MHVFSVLRNVHYGKGHRLFPNLHCLAELDIFIFDEILIFEEIKLYMYIRNGINNKLCSHIYAS